jgi:hypothetical protein
LGRKLTHEERMAARGHFLEEERARHPGTIVDLLVAPNLTSEGALSYTLYLTTVKTITGRRLDSDQTASSS